MLYAGRKQLPNIVPLEPSKYKTRCCLLQPEVRYSGGNPLGNGLLRNNLLCAQRVFNKASGKTPPDFKADMNSARKAEIPDALCVLTGVMTGPVLAAATTLNISSLRENQNLIQFLQQDAQMTKPVTQTSSNNRLEELLKGNFPSLLPELSFTSANDFT